MIRPNTTLGRALAARSLDLSERQAHPAAHPGDLIDLTTPEALIPPPHVREAANAALDRGETHYTVRPGVPELRAAIARRSTEDGFPSTVDGTVVTNGGAEALYIALQSTLKPGGVLLAGAPLAPNVIEMVEFIGARVERLPLDVDYFLPNAADVGRAAGTVLLLATPSPVTGVALPLAELQQILSAAIDRDMTVIVDRSLAWCCFDPAVARCPDPDLGARVLTTGSFSSAYALGGWRVGYFTAPPAQVATMRNLKQAMSICTSAVSQFAALAALEGPTEWLKDREITYAVRRDLVLSFLSFREQSALPTDAWPPMLLDTRWIDPDDRVAAQRLAAEHGFIVEPASRYGEALRGFVRIDLSVPKAAFSAFLDTLRVDDDVVDDDDRDDF